MWHFRKIAIGLFVLFLMSNACIAKTLSTVKGEKYIISSAPDAQSEHWAEYAYRHFVSRTENKLLVTRYKGAIPKHIPEGYQVIHFEVSNNLKDDYTIRSEGQILYLRVRNDRIALWMVYQFIEKVAQVDARFTAQDLPPAYLAFKDGRYSFDFEYRDPFFPFNLKPELAPILGTNSVDIDWGIWGHNLSKVVKEVKDSTIYALIKGKRNKDQLCFSSPVLFRQLSDYINNNFGNGDEKSYRFMILPQDNHLVCMDSLCEKIGNTKDNATPAVVYLMRKLVQRFPKHYFFTTAYKTTRTPPDSALPEHTGVFLSTISLPKGRALNKNQPKTKAFLSLLSAWRKKIPRVYIWDYAANFDDYLTPVPVLYGLKKQLKFFKAHHIKGVFLNGSGYDYTTFGDVKTYVAAGLMMDVNSNIDTLCSRFFRKNYPKTHQLLSHYYLSLEKIFSHKQTSYPMYGGIRAILPTYLDKERFVRFYKNVGEKIPWVSGKEKHRLQKLYTALTFTRLQIAYQSGADTLGYAIKKGKTMQAKPLIGTLIDRLKKFKDYPDMQSYKEAHGSLKKYCENWKQFILQDAYKNILLDDPIKIISDKKIPEAKTALLHNGIPGFAMDYHQGWYISNQDIKVQFSLQQPQGKRTLQLRFLVDKIHDFYPPKSILIKKNGKLIKTIHQKELGIEQKTAKYRCSIRTSKKDRIELMIVRQSLPHSKLACDEIQVI